MVIPGANSFAEGKVKDGIRDTIWGYLPFTWISDAVAGMFIGLYEMGKRDADNVEKYKF